MLLDHSFEILLKAVIFEKTGRIRRKRDKYNYSFDKCVDICKSQLKVLDKDEALLLRNLKRLP